eukprot:Mycagemm_TRINITY_DN9999_c0_g2::TRINITY_DN9999_c0_g2_i1::g.3478::m.3478 type:complete len:135 gc:universal TRINITY_DN9999_c0_g2_i1:373-777(+)
MAQFLAASVRCVRPVMALMASSTAESQVVRPRRRRVSRSVRGLPRWTATLPWSPISSQSEERREQARSGSVCVSARSSSSGIFTSTCTRAERRRSILRCSLCTSMMGTKPMARMSHVCGTLLSRASKGLVWLKG